MSFPQTTAVNAIRNGQDIWRLFTPAESSGDIYEAEVSARSLVVGPDSDIGRYVVNYYDVQNPNIVNMATFSIDKPWIGRLDALPARTYASGDVARLLISTDDLMPPTGFRPPTAAEEDAVEIVQPNFDVLFYLQENPTFIQPRANQIHLFEQLPGPLDKSNWFLVPFYSRRFGEVTAKNLAFGAAADYTLNVFGINFSNVIAPGVGAPPQVGHQEELLGTATVSVGETDSVTITNRGFDYLAVELDPTGGDFSSQSQAIVHITTSDKI